MTGRFDGGVTALRATPRIREHSDLRVCRRVSLEQLHRAVGGATVGYHDLGWDHIPGEHRIEHVERGRALVEHGGDDRDTSNRHHIVRWEPHAGRGYANRRVDTVC